MKRPAGIGIGESGNGFKWNQWTKPNWCPCCKYAGCYDRSIPMFQNQWSFACFQSESLLFICLGWNCWMGFGSRGREWWKQTKLPHFSSSSRSQHSIMRMASWSWISSNNLLTKSLQFLIRLERGFERGKGGDRWCWHNWKFVIAFNFRIPSCLRPTIPWHVGTENTTRCCTQRWSGLGEGMAMWKQTILKRARSWGESQEGSPDGLQEGWRRTKICPCSYN